MARAGFSLIWALAAVTAISGCAWVGEERAHAMGREWREATSGAWFDEAGERLDLGETFGTARGQEAENEKQICLHGNSSNRVVRQDGVSDRVDYRRCVLAPYATEQGSRLGNRPDGVGRVTR